MELQPLLPTLIQSVAIFGLERTPEPVKRNQLQANMSVAEFTEIVLDAGWKASLPVAENAHSKRQQTNTVRALVASRDCSHQLNHKQDAPCFENWKYHRSALEMILSCEPWNFSFRFEFL